MLIKNDQPAKFYGTLYGKTNDAKCLLITWGRHEENFIQIKNTKNNNAIPS